MTEQTKTQHSLNYKSFSKGALCGAGLALVLLAILMISLEGIDYGAWISLPIVMVSVGGAVGGAYHSFMDHLRYEGGWEKAYADICSLVVYTLLLWFSLIGALHITGHWN